MKKILNLPVKAYTLTMTACLILFSFVCLLLLSTVSLSAAMENILGGVTLCSAAAFGICCTLAVNTAKRTKYVH